MSKTIRHLSGTVAVLLVFTVSLGVLLAPASFAGTRTVDGNPNDWIGTPPAAVNTYTVENGEWIWKDNTGDQRTDVEGHENCDMSEFRVTGDTENIYFLLRFTNMTDAWRVLVYIAVDTTLNSAGNEWFPDFTTTLVNANARWERVIKASVATTGYYNTSWQYTTAGASYFSATNKTVEISMPWSALGVSLPATLRFTVMICADNGSGFPVDIGGGSISDALDVITTVSGNTWGEVSDNVIDYYFDVNFDSSGNATYGTGLIAETSKPMYVTLSPGIGYVQIVSISDNINFGSVTAGETKEALTNPFTVVVNSENVSGVDVYIKGTDLTGGGWTIGVDNIEHRPFEGGSWVALTKTYALLRGDLAANQQHTIRENFRIKVPVLNVPTTVNFTGTVWVRVQDNSLPAP
ncbi:MAG: hypothetical protein QXU01_01665 [Candidatus Hadarchaeales archaeon]